MIGPLALLRKQFTYFLKCFSDPGPFLYKYDVLMEKLCFLDSSPQNHEESRGNFVENSFAKSGTWKFHEKSEFGHVHEHQKLQVRSNPPEKHALICTLIRSLFHAYSAAIGAACPRVELEDADRGHLALAALEFAAAPL